MLEPGRIASIIAADKYSRRKKQARTGQKYYDGEHEILQYRIFYITKEGTLKEDLTKSNIRTPHPFFHEIAEQEVAYILSNGIQFKAGTEELQEYLKPYFGDAFIGEIKEVITDAVVRGFGYAYWYRDVEGTTRFCHADSMGIVEVKDGDTSDTVNDYVDYLMYQAEKNGAMKGIRVDENGNVSGVEELVANLKKSHAGQFEPAAPANGPAMVRTGIKKLDNAARAEDVPQTLEEAIAQKYSGEEE